MINSNQKIHVGDPTFTERLELLLGCMKIIRILKPVAKLKMWDLTQKANNFKLDIIF